MPHIKSYNNRYYYRADRKTWVSGTGVVVANYLLKWAYFLGKNSAVFQEKAYAEQLEKRAIA